MNMNLITSYIYDLENGFWLTCQYGHPELQHRQHIWDQLTLQSQSIKDDDEWIVLGNFNQVLFKKDKISFKDCNLRGSNQLRECLDNCMLSKIPLKRQYLTWKNNRQGEDVFGKDWIGVLPTTSGLETMVNHNF